MRGLEGKEIIVRGGKGKTQSETREKEHQNQNKLKTKTKQRDTRRPNEVRLQTSVTCVE